MFADINNRWKTYVMLSLKSVSIGVACLLGLSACGELAYKRGGQADELAAVRARCHAAATPQIGYEKCMEQAGWTVQQLDEEIPLATLSVNPDNRATEAPLVSSSKTEPTTKASTEATKSAAAVAEVAPVKRSHPNDLLTVSSWWKMGGTPGALNSATEACVEKLGDSHRPAPGKQTATRALVLCLRESGWYGVANR